MTFSLSGDAVYVSRSPNSGNNIWEYSLSTPWDISTGVYSGNVVDTPEATFIQGLAWRPDGDKFYTFTSDLDRVYQYSASTSWDLSSISYDSVFYDYSTEIIINKDSRFNGDGTRFYVTRSNNVWQYNLSDPWIVSSASYSGIQKSTNAETTSSQSFYITPSESSMYICARSPAIVYQYNQP